MITKRRKADVRREQQRLLLFADVPKEELWSNSLKGWCWIPRTMPLVLQAIRLLSKGTSAAETYFALWCNCVSESIVEMNNKGILIAAAGYSGASHERTWKERMKKLGDLGFIKIAPGTHGDISCVLILNPHKVLRRHMEGRKSALDKKLYNTIMEQIAAYGMLDFKEPPKSPLPVLRPVPPPPRIPDGAPKTLGRSRTEPGQN